MSASSAASSSSRLTSGAVFSSGTVPPSSISPAVLRARVHLEEHVLEAGLRAQQDRRVLVDGQVVAVDAEGDDGDAVLELDVLDVADLDAGDPERLALAGDDGLGRLELGLELEGPLLEHRDPQPLVLHDHVGRRRSPTTSSRAIATKSRKCLLIAVPISCRRSSS